MKIFWNIYDFILTVISAIVISAYIVGILSCGLPAFKDYTFVPIFTNTYMGLCAFRIIIKFYQDAVKK